MRMGAISVLTLVFMSLTAGYTTAQTTILTASGTVTSLTAFQNNSVIASPAGKINVGDGYSFKATFDFSTAELTALYNADPTINIYYLPGTSVSLTIGSYSESFSTPLDLEASAQLWNNRVIVNSPVDSESVSVLHYDVPVTPSLPFSLGAGMTSEGINFDAFDPTATARSNDLITSISPLSLFSEQSFSYDLLNSTTSESVIVNGSVSASSFVSSAPEPAIWILLLSSIGIVGGALRLTKVGRHRRDLRASTFT